MLKDVIIPDLGSTQTVDVIELLVKVGDKVEKEAPLLSLESDKATMEVPAPFAGTVQSIAVTVGQKVSPGMLILVLESGETDDKKATQPTKAEPPTETRSASAEAKPEQVLAAPVSDSQKHTPAPSLFSATASTVYAGPSVRRFARELGVDLTQVKGSGRKQRIQQEDIQAYVKSILSGQGAAPASAGGLGLQFPPLQDIDFAAFGEIEKQPLSRIKKLSGSYLQRNAVLVPHVTQFDEADITDLEAFRQSVNHQAGKTGIKVTPLVIIMKAVVAALKKYPQFNASLDTTQTALILKKYYHLGVAVDTPNGLVVAVIRDVDKKGIYALSQELGETSEKARTRGLSAADMQGGTFTISSLGGIGGTAFTPIVNLPDVAILGVSRSSMKPVYQAGNFVPRLMLPLSLSYDHRVIDGAEGARFTRYVSELLSDIRQLLL